MSVERAGEYKRHDRKGQRYNSEFELDKIPPHLDTSHDPFIFIMTDKQDAVSTADSAAASKDTSNNGIGGPKAIIKSVDMGEDLQQESVDIATSALEKYNIEKDIAAQIKKEFDRRHGPTWHVVVGKNFGSYVTHGLHPVLSLLEVELPDDVLNRRNKTFHLLLHRFSRDPHLEVIIQRSSYVVCESRSCPVVPSSPYVTLRATYIHCS